MSNEEDIPTMDEDTRHEWEKLTNADILEKDLKVLGEPGTTNLIYGERGTGKSRLAIWMMQRILDFFPDDKIITNMRLWPRSVTSNEIIRRFDAKENPKNGGGPIVPETRIIRCFSLSEILKTICLSDINTIFHIFIDESGNIFEYDPSKGPELRSFKKFSRLARKWRCNENIITPRQEDVPPFYRGDTNKPGITEGFIEVNKRRVHIRLKRRNKNQTWLNDVTIIDNNYWKDGTLTLEYFIFDSLNPSSLKVDTDCGLLFELIGDLPPAEGREKALEIIDDCRLRNREQDEETEEIKNTPSTGDFFRCNDIPIYKVFPSGYGLRHNSKRIRKDFVKEDIVTGTRDRMKLSALIPWLEIKRAALQEWAEDLEEYDV